MRDLLRELRTIVEHERALRGDLLPLTPATSTDGPPPSSDPDPEESSPAVSGTTDSSTAPPPSDDSGVPSDDADAPPSTTSSDDSSSDEPMPNRDLFGNQVDPTEDPSLPPWKRVESLVPDDAPDDFLWVTDFPLLEYDDEAGRYLAMHHPFTSPREGDFDTLDEDPGAARARAYDLVLNGNEIGGGAECIGKSAGEVTVHGRARQRQPLVDRRHELPDFVEAVVILAFASGLCG